MQSAVVGAAARQRFEAALARVGIPEEEWGREWKREIDVFEGPLRGGRGAKSLSRGFLSDIHCFVLANVLRRPIVIYGMRYPLLPPRLLPAASDVPPVHGR